MAFLAKKIVSLPRPAPSSTIFLPSKNLSDFYKKLHSIIELEIVEDNNSKTIN